MKRMWKSGFVLIVWSLSMILPLTTLAQDGAFWGISLNGFAGTPGGSSLYQIDPVTGAGTLIGTDLGYAVNAIAVDPTTGIMYASTTSWSGDFNGLLQVNTTAGTATEIGEFGDSFISVLALTFDSSGQLWGWHDPGADDPVKIDKTTGAATTVGDSGTGTAGHVLAFDASDTLFMIQNSSVYIINQTTGAAVAEPSLSFDPGSGGAAFDPVTDLLWASTYNGRTQDSFIRLTDIAGDSFTDIDTDIEYLNAVTIGGTVTGIDGATSTRPVPVMNAWSIALLIMLICGGAIGLLRRRHF